MTSFASRTRANGGWLAFRIRLLLALALVLAASAPAGARAATNNIFTVAGTSFGFSGDGGPATAAQFAGPAGVAASPDGGVLISDTGNDRVRRVSPAGTITTVAGTDGGLSGDGGPATEAQLDGPIGVAVTAGRRLSDHRHLQSPDPAGIAGRHDHDRRRHRRRVLGRRRPGDRRPARQPVRGGREPGRRLPDRRHRQ